MSAPSPKRHEFNAYQEAELARWPGVTWRREHRSKHYALVLTFAGVSRFVIYPTSPGDTVRGGLNHVRDIRAALTALGATRQADARSERPRDRAPLARPPETGKLVDFTPAETRLNRDPFAALASFQPRPRGWARVRAYFVRPPKSSSESCC